MNAKMDRNTACFLLGISPEETLDGDRLRRQYLAQSRRLHPDKNPAPDAAEQFQCMHEAYAYLSEMDQGAGADKWSGGVTELWEWFQDGCRDQLTQWIQRLDRDTLFRMHAILTATSTTEPTSTTEHTKKMSSGMHKAMQHIQSLVAASLKIKCSRDEKKVLRPTLADVLSDQVFRLVVEDQTYWIPLWVDELVYDLGDREMVVQCIPTLPPNVVVDDRHKHLYIHCGWSIVRDVWGKETVDVVVDGASTLRYSVRVSQLRITDQPQKILLSTHGIAQTSMDHVYDVSRRGSVFAIVTLTA